MPLAFMTFLQGLSARDLTKVRDQLKNAAEVRMLGSALGVHEQRIERALHDNRKFSGAALRIISDWKNAQPDEKQAKTNLIHALHMSGLGRIASRVFPDFGESIDVQLAEIRHT